MKTKTATIQRVHLWRTNQHYLALYYRGNDYSPGYEMCIPDAPPDDAQGIETLKKQARRLGFTHVRFNGWSAQTKPKGGKL